jgi:hypothetical protein
MGPDAPICSAKACREPAVWALRWNNPRIHPPERRKTWLACERHRTSLSEFLDRRGFLRETEATAATPATAGTQETAVTGATTPPDGDTGAQ